MKNSAKKSIALLLTILMLLGVATPFAFAVEQTDVTPGYYKAYDEAEEGELLYAVDFRGDDYYSPSTMTNYANLTSATPSEDGNSISITGTGTTFYGAQIDGMPLKDRAYTLTYTFTRDKQSIAGLYVDANHENYANNGFAGRAHWLNYYNGTGTYSTEYSYANYGNITPLDLNADDGAYVTNKIKITVDGVGGTMAYYILTDEATQRYEKVMEILLSRYPLAPDGNLGVFIMVMGAYENVVLSDVEIHKGGAMSTSAAGKLLLSLGNLNEVNTNSATGVTYTPSVAQNTKEYTNKLTYNYTDGVHSMSNPASSTTKYVFGGTTNLRVGGDAKYTISYYTKKNTAVGGDVGMSWLSHHNTEDALVHGLYIQNGGANGGEPALRSTKIANTGYTKLVDYNKGLGNTFIHDGYALYQIEIDGSNVRVYVNGVQAHNFDYTTNMYGALSVVFFDDCRATGGATSSYYKDIKIYSGNIVSEKYIDVIDGETTETVGIPASETTYTLPTRTAPAGYVFKGWIVDDAKDEETGKSIITAPGTAVSTTNLKKIEAVYVKAMSEAWVQFGNTDTENNTTDMRIVGVLDSLKYSSIGYDIVIKYMVDGEEQTYTSANYELHNVYNSLLAKYGTEVVTPETLKFGADSGYYLTAFTIFNVPTNIGEITFELTPYQIDLDGNKMPGEKITLSFTEMWAKNNASGN